MDKRSTLHWGALLLAIYAFAWMILPLLNSAIVFIPLLALAGFILLVIQGRRLAPEERTLVLTGAWLGIILYGLWVLLSLAGTPISTEDSGNYDPPEAFRTIADAMTPALPALGAIAAVLAFWPLWRSREQVLGAAGAAVVAIITVTSLAGVGTASEGLGTVLQLLFSAGFLALAVALAFPVMMPDQNKPVWSHEAA